MLTVTSAARMTEALDLLAVQRYNDYLIRHYRIEVAEGEKIVFVPSDEEVERPDDK